MLVMALAHAQKSGDGRLIYTYYNLLRKWADFLVANSLVCHFSVFTIPDVRLFDAPFKHFTGWTGCNVESGTQGYYRDGGNQQGVGIKRGRP